MALRGRDVFYLSTHERSFTKVAETKDIPAGAMLKVKINEKAILIVNVDGKYYAIDNTCSHNEGDLSEGTLSGHIVTCPLHGSQFNVTNGKNVKGPKMMMFRGKTDNLNAYETKVEGDDILVFQKSTWGM
jgi:nitrite reductase/ring-hydroxylating ferredoxin subunit